MLNHPEHSGFLSKRKPERYFEMAVILLWIIFSVIRAGKGSDFEVYLDAAKTINAHGNIYDPANTRIQYFYSPFFALVLSWFLFLPLWTIKFIWLLFSGLCLWRVIYICRAFLQLSKYPRNIINIATWAPAIILSGFFMDNMHMVQVTFFIFFLSMEALYQVFIKKNFLLGGILLGLGINIKIVPLIFLPLLIYRKKFSGAAVTMIVALGLVFLPFILDDLSYQKYLLQHWWLTINPSKPGHVLELEQMICNIPSLISTKFVPLGQDESYLSGETIGQVKLMIYIAQLVMITGTLYILATFPFKDAMDNRWSFREISYLFALIPLIFPHQNKYNYVYLFPMLLYLFTWFYSGRAIIPKWTSALFWMIAASSIIMITFSTRTFTGKELGFFLAYHKVIAIGSLLMVLLLYIARPHAGMISGRSPSSLI